MTTIVTRAGKGSPLTNAEVDQNFLNLNADKLEAGDLSPYLLSATAASTYQTIAGMSSYLTTASASSTYLTQANASSTYQTQAGMSSYLTTASAASTYAPLASPTLTGTPAAPTAAADTNTTQIATTAFVVGQGYLKSATAASTYLTQANAASTYQTQSGMANYLTSANAALTYQPILVSGTNLKTINGTSLLGGGDLTITAGVSSFNTRTGAITLTSGDVTTALGFTPYDAANPSGYVTQAGARSAISVTQNLSYNSTTGVITGPDLSAYLTSATAASTYQTQAGMSSYLTTAAASSTYLTQANAASTYQTQSGMSSYLTTASAASTYLTQANAASTYQTQAGMSSYLTSATAASTYLALAGGTLTGSLAFSGTSLRITGDFTSATASSRLMVQTSTANGQTFFGLIPNGTAVNTQFQVYNAADPANASVGSLVAAASTVRVVSGNTGTGTLLPIVFVFNSTEAARFATNGNLLLGTTTDNGTDRLQVSGTIKSLTGGFVFPDGTTQTTAATGGGGTATNLAGGSANQIPYQTGAGATSFIAAPTTASTYLQWNGTGFTWAAAGGGGGGITTGKAIAMAIVFGG